MKIVYTLLLTFFISITYSYSQERETNQYNITIESELVAYNSSVNISCNELFQYVKSKGMYYGEVHSYTMNSSWLKKVTAYSYDYKIYVIAEIKENEYSYSTSSYIFCGIPTSNWNNFKMSYGGSDSYGERFHQYIIDYKCDCD